MPRLTVSLVVISLLGLAFLPLITTRPDRLNLLILIFLGVLLAQSWNMLAGLAGQINLGHAAFFGLGALATRLLWMEGLPIALAVPAGGVVALLFGLLLGAPAFRLRGAYFAIGTLGLAEILRITVGNVLPIISAMPVDYVSHYSLIPRYYLFLALASLCCSTTWALSRSRLGYGLLALREDEDAAEASGVPTLRHKLFALCLSTLFAGLAGGAFAFYHASYYYQQPFSPSWTFEALLMTFIGGVGTTVGPVLGAIFYVVVKEFLAVQL
ncbi:MAG TPA: branched-chain amino acid ABC transporter permease, partial [Candidatus Methylomirabilis sp.]|nr:branched-chain amino acid ABC transporter permease [Candidatus Methylomirabilis sp.]